MFVFYFALLADLICPCWAESGKAWYADPNTGIQRIIYRASAGDTVFVKKGEYDDEVMILMKEGVSLVGVPEALGSAIIKGNPQYPLIYAVNHVTIENLVIQDALYGIYCPGKDPDNNPVTGITIKNNLIKRNKTGIYVASDHVGIIRNTIVHNEKKGINIFMNPNGPAFYGEENIIAFNGPFGGIEFEQRDDPNEKLPDFLDPTVHTTLRYNDIYDPLYHMWLHIDSNERIPLLSLSAFGPENFSKDPFFVDPNAGDYHLLSYSPCIDRGDPNSDFSQEESPNGERVNLGFYGNTKQAAISEDYDDDGLYDYVEGIGDMDGDGVQDWEDADSVVIPLPERVEKISIHAQDPGYDPTQMPKIKDAGIVSPPELSIDPPPGRIPFDIIQFSIVNIEEGATILVKTLLPKRFKALEVSQYYTRSSGTSWESLSFEMDLNENAVTFYIQDGWIGDRDGIQNGAIDHLSAIIFPHSVTWENPETCFISSIYPYSFHYKSLSRLRDYQGKGYRIGDAAIFLLIMVLIIFLSKRRALRKRWYTALIIFIFLPLLFSAGWAQIKEDIEITSSPNPVGSGARALGMGGAFIGVADDATAASWNPAGLKHLGKPEVSWVEAYSSRSENYSFEKSPEASGKYNLSEWDINYLSVAYPLRLFNKNLFVSLNFQHLYDFSKKLSYSWRSFSEGPYRDIDYRAIYEQSGGLRALSPAAAVTVSPGLTFGFTVNIWSDSIFKNEWIEKYHKDGEGEIDVDRKPVITHVDLLERYAFSGLNFHVGMLWDIHRTCTLGLVFKTPFKADLERFQIKYTIEEYPLNPDLDKYLYTTRTYKERLSMPASYGIGLSYQPIDLLVFGLDVYRTEWGDYEFLQEDGSRINPITGYHQSKAKVKPTHQIRLGAEYVFINQKSLIPTLRGGIFYDPAPAQNKPDEFYGISVGTGLTLREKKRSDSRRAKRGERQDIMSIDMAYQYRWGRKVEGKTIQGENSPADVDHHLIYLSLIYYFKGKT